MKNKQTTTKKNPIVLFFTVIFAFLIISFGVGFLVYISEEYPDFNNLIDDILSNITRVQKEERTELKNNNEVQEKSQAFDILPYIYEYEPSFRGLLNGEVSSKKQESLTTGSDKMAILSDGYELSFLSKTIYIGNYPIVSRPILYADCIVFLDAKPSLVQCNYVTGEIRKTPSPVYPSAFAIRNANSYIFSGRDGNQYVFSFGKDASISTIATSFVEKNTTFTLSDFTQSLYPSKKSLSSIKDNVFNWMELESFYEFKNPIRLAPRDMNVGDNIGSVIEKYYLENMMEPSFFVFNPLEQGVFKVGLCDENEGWLKMRAFVSVFSAKGELLAVSLDYVADEPLLSLHLSDRKLYYILCGSFGENIDKEDFSSYLLIKKVE